MKKFSNRLKISIFILLLLFAFLPGETISSATQAKPAQELSPLFADLPKDYWAYQVINQLVERKLLAGYPDGTFRPENTLSRAEFAAILARAANLTLPSVDKPIHQDVGLSEWYTLVIGATYNYIGDFPGPDGGRLFKPGEPILREQAITALLKTRQDDQKTPINPDILSVKFSDHDKITTELKKMLAWAVEQGLVAGYADGTFRPQGTLTRAEAAALLTRMYPQIEIFLKAFLESGELVPLTSTDPQYNNLVEQLQQNYPVLAVSQTPVKFQYFARDFSLGAGSKEKLLYVFVAVDPFKYFTFSDVDFKNKPDAVLEFNEAITRQIGNIFPNRQIIVLIGYTNTLFYNPSGVYDDRFINYNQQEGVWQIVRYYTGVRLAEGKILEKWIEK